MVRIVIAEDNIGFSDVLDLNLSAIPNFSIVSKVKDGYEALDALKNADAGVDVLVMDAIMPKFDGIAVLEALHQQDIKKPAVILSVPAKNDYIAYKASQLGVSAVFVKPVNMSVLIEKSISSQRIEKTAIRIISCLWMRTTTSRWSAWW